MKNSKRRLASDAPKSLEEAMAKISPMSEGVYQWAAGFVEADGCIHIGKSGGRNMKKHPLERFHIVLTVTQKDPRPVNFLVSLFGGKIQKVLRRKVWEYNQWIVCANEAYAAIVLLEPHLRFKKEQANLAISLQKSVNEYRGKWSRWGRIPMEVSYYRRSLYLRCRFLNSKEYISSLNIESGEFGGPLKGNAIETIPSQAETGQYNLFGLTVVSEGVTATRVSPNNNLAQECPTLHRG